METYTLTESQRKRCEAVLERPILRARRVRGGYTAALRLVVEHPDNRSTFLKIATSNHTADWLRSEARAYAALEGPFLPAFVAFDDGPDEAAPILALEDLSHAHWPPPWQTQQVERLSDAVTALGRCTPRTTLALPRVSQLPMLTRGWHEIAKDPSPFLSLQLVTPLWLERAQPLLLSMDLERELDGDTLVHLDVRSDNCCFAGERTLLIDYNWLSRGHPAVDLACAAPSMHLEGVSEARSLAVRHLPSLVAVAGYFASHAGLPSPAGARSDLRGKQLACCRVTLKWLATELQLPPPDGPNAPE